MTGIYLDNYGNEVIDEANEKVSNALGLDLLKKVDTEISLKKAVYSLFKTFHMSSLRRKFNKEEKLEIVKQSLEADVLLEDLAAQYKIHVNSLYKWRREYLRHEEASFPGQGNKVQSAEQQEIERLKRQLGESELEKEILKKALGIFSSPNRKNLLL